jgi:hypothetical protein
MAPGADGLGLSRQHRPASPTSNPESGFDNRAGIVKPVSSTRLAQRPSPPAERSAFRQKMAMTIYSLPLWVLAADAAPQRRASIRLESGSLRLLVLAKGTPLGADLYCRSTERIPFDRELGQLSQGDTVYVCIGPDETDQDDSFDVDFSIGRL